MNVFLMVNDWVGYQVAAYLKENNERIVGVAVHPPETRRYTEDILHVLDLSPRYVFDAKLIHSAASLEAIRALRPDVIITAYWGYLLKPVLFTLPSRGSINLHGSFLPFNRGKNPNVWPIIEGTPAGATLHYIDAGIDSGDIISQRQVPVVPIDTAKTLYDKIVHTMVELFKETWPAIRTGQAGRTPQDSSAATFHLAKDFGRLDWIDLDKTYTARELLNLLRARTFAPYPSVCVLDEGRRIRVRVELGYVEGESGGDRR